MSKQFQPKKEKIKVARHMPSAIFTSLIIHVALFFIAGTIVFTVHKRKEKKFKAPPVIERPKKKLKKPKVRMKSKPKPKPSTRLTSRVSQNAMPDIQLPKVTGISGGLELQGIEFDAPKLEEMSVFGGGQSIGNDFIGTLYDLKKTRSGREKPIDRDGFRTALRNFILSGWDLSTLSEYYRLPKKLYTSNFMIPAIPSPMAPDAFGSPRTEGYYFFIHYKGDLVYKEDITFRFWGVGDAFLFINIGGKEIFLDTWDWHRPFYDWWTIADPSKSQKYYLGPKMMEVSDWITLKAGEPVEMNVILGDDMGGLMAAMLLVEVQGETYPQSEQGGPILPIFKTEELSRDAREDIEALLPEGQANLTNGPTFRDF